MSVAGVRVVEFGPYNITIASAAGLVTNGVGTLWKGTEKTLSSRRKSRPWKCL